MKKLESLTPGYESPALYETTAELSGMLASSPLFDAPSLEYDDSDAEGIWSQS